jgi:hypothetical protein
MMTSYLYLLGAVRTYQITKDSQTIKILAALGWPIWETIIAVTDTIEWYRERP